MEGRLIVLFAALTVFVASGVQGTSHLSFANNTEVNITRDGCGTAKLCLDEPIGCDPSTNATCLFVSFAVTGVMPPNGANLTVELRGDITQPMGYVAMGLTNTQGSTMLFVCARNGSDNETFFRTLKRNNTGGMFMPEEITVREIRLMAKDNVTRCEFNILHLNATRNRNSEDTTFTVTAGSGALTADGGIGTFSPSLNKTLNVADPTANNAVNATMAPGNTTAAPGNMTTTASSGAVHPHALLILLSVLTLFAMLRA